MKITKAFIETTTGVLKVQSTLKRCESIQLARVVNTVSYKHYSNIQAKTGQARRYLGSPAPPIFQTLSNAGLEPPAA